MRYKAKIVNATYPNTEHSMHIKKKKKNRRVGAAISNIAVFKFIVVADCKESTFKVNQMFQTIQ